ncbi:hypothetical protein GIB67_020870 [Kingdonia uniflora]|uniref:Uncharacterized protein n=1 Tax=Kingdonia uniflora TaxID=39325 RepID=A0A7J7M7C8_9MAGN|nr:hypothetical protein GIB67_020870 [Kingdonia uniflora]
MEPKYEEMSKVEVKEAEEVYAFYCNLKILSSPECIGKIRNRSKALVKKEDVVAGRKVCGVINGRLKVKGEELITADDLCVYYTLKQNLSKIGYRYLARFLRRPLFYEMVSTWEQYFKECLLVSENYEFDWRNPGEALKRKTFYLERDAMLTKTFGKGKKKRAASQAVAPLLPSKMASRRSTIEEKLDVTPSGIPDNRPPKADTNLLSKKKAASESTKKKFVEESETEVQHTMDAYVSGTTTLEVEFDNCLIMKLLIEAKLHILGAGTQANQIMSAQRAIEVEHVRVLGEVRVEVIRDNLDTLKKMKANFVRHFETLEERKDFFKGLVVSGNQFFLDSDMEDEVLGVPLVPERLKHRKLL